MSEVRRLYRDPGHRIVAGVASGIAAHLGLPTIVVRVAFIALLPIDGLGALLYAAFWAVLPVPPRPPGAKPSKRDRRQVIPFLALGVGILLVSQLSGLGSGPTGALGWLVALIAVGAGIIWHLADPTRRQQWREAVPQAPWLGMAFDETDRRSFLIRLIGGGALVMTGLVGVIVVVNPSPGTGLKSITTGLIFSIVALAGVAVVVAPLLWRTVAQLRTERVARIREQERAELAAMVHDQVLHTLALIQRNSGDAKAVLRLARGQERSLRNWLYKPTASAWERLSAALEEAAAEVEDTYAIAVETVMVGDRDVDEKVSALVAAAREAMVNAAKHAKVTTISLYGEVEPDSISVFVRDRGVGFDLSTVEGDRHGVRGSIIGRMERHGGRAEIRSEPGEGTEVRLTMPVPQTRRDRNG